VCGNQARVKNADLHHPSWTVVMYKRKSASPVHSVLKALSHRLYNLFTLSALLRFLLQLG